MRIIIDNREHDLIEKCNFKVSNEPNYATIETDVLHVGDILFKTDEGKDVLLIERKTLQDMIASIKDGRYEEQSHRLKYASGFSSHNVIYLIEGMFSTLKNPLEKKLILSAMTSLLYFKGFSTIRTSGLQESADFIIHMADKIDRNFVKGILPWYLSSPIKCDLEKEGEEKEKEGEEKEGEEEKEEKEGEEEKGEKELQQPPIYAGFVKKVKKENITPDNMGEILLCQIPGISSQYAQSILKHFDSFSNLLTEVKNGTVNFENILYETKGKQRRVPKSCGEEIKRFFSKI